MKIYTKTGDGGDTGLFGAGRVSKASGRVAAYGDVDELNAAVGWAITQVSDADIKGRLETIQHDLFALGSELATPPAAEGRRRPETPGVPDGRVEQMESWMDEADTELPELRVFVLPGGTTGAAALHVCRTVCRRAERMVVALAADDEVGAPVLAYLNRLSDTLFTFARLENHRAGVGDVEWRKEASSD